MKKLKGLFVGSLCAVMLSIGIGCCVGLIRNEKTFAQAVEVSDFAGLANAVSNDAANVVVLGDIAFDSTIVVGRNVKISSNGNFSLKRASGFQGAMIEVNDGANLEVSCLEGSSLAFDGENLLAENQGILNDGTLILGKNVSVKNFKTSKSGAAINNSGTLILRGGEVSNNTLESGAASTYGIIYNAKNSKFTLESGAVHSNTSDSSGIIFMHDGTTGLMTGGEIYNNISVSGSGFFVKSSSVNIKGGTIYNNTATSYGGGVYGKDSAKIFLEGGVIRNNTANTSGGAVYLKESASVVFDGVEISSNYAKSYGGALYLLNNSNAVVKSGSFISNSAKSSGGAFFINTKGSVLIEDCQATGNNSGNGGAFTSKRCSEFKITGGTFSGNTSSKFGGAVYVYDAGNLTVEGGTFANNGTTGKDVYVTAGRTIQLLGGSFADVVCNGGIVEVGGDLNVSEKIKMMSAVTASNGYIQIASELTNSVVIEAFAYTIETAATENTLFRVANNPYINVYGVLDKIALTDATKTLKFDKNKILMVEMANEIQVLADERVITAPKTATNGQTVEFSAIEGYEISNVSIVDNLGTEISFITIGDGFRFEMPADSGVKIDFDFSKTNMPISVDNEIKEFVEVSSTGKYKDLIKVSLKKVKGKKLETLKVGNETWSQTLDLINPEFLMFAGATLSGTIFDYTTILDTISGDVVQVFNEAELRQALTVDGSIIAIMDDITLSETINVGKGTFTLMSINRSSIFRGQSCKEHMFALGWETTLNLGVEGLAENELFIDGCNAVDTIGSLIFLEDGGIVNMYNGVVLQNNKLNSMNIAYTRFGKGNGSAGGAGVYNYNGIFNMFGGSIEGNTTSFNGSGVYNFGRFNLFGGNIQNNQTTASGGGVYNYRVFNQDGGNILNNSCTGSGWGGGVYNAAQIYAYYYLVNGKVSGNSSKPSGGGIYVAGKGVAWIKGGEISGNSTSNNGGGICSKGTLFVIGGVIKNNAAVKNGGGIHIYADDKTETFGFIRGGSVENNTSSAFGGGISISDTNDKVPVIEISGVKVSDNVSPDGAQVYINGGAVEIGTGVQIVGKLSTGKEPSKKSGYLKFVGQLDFALEIDPFKYADYQNEQYNVLVVDESVDASMLAEKIKLSNSQYNVKVVENNLYICPVA